MTTPDASELALLRTQPHTTRLYLSIYKPRTVFQAQVNDASAAKGMRTIAWDNGTGDDFLVTAGKTLYVGTTPGGKDKGSIYVYAYGGGLITVGENSHINWADNDYITVVDFFQIWPLYPRYEQVGDTVTVYKMYNIGYTGQNEVLGSWICMGPHHAGFLENGSHQVYYTSAGTVNLDGESLDYDWQFYGGTPTGSNLAVPGYVTYDTPGHYWTKLTVSGTTGSFEAAVRNVSIYDRPGEGTNTPILSWGLESLQGSRDQGGYTARLWVEEDIDDIVDGALVVIFADDWYGNTQQSIGGNAENREQTVFVGYIMGDTIEFDYQRSRVSFEVGSPTEIMKQCEAFSVSLEDSTNPIADAAAKGGSPWFYLVGLNVRTAIYHYLRWHSNVNYNADIRFLATGLPIQYFDADRTSLYDAVNSLMQNALIGAVCSDRQGRIYMEQDASAIATPTVNLPTSMFVDRHDWIGMPDVVERMSNEISYIEAGGVSYDVVTGTFTPYLACAPGVTPAYRGTQMKITGLALSDQSTLNAMVGRLYAYKNSKYPRVNLNLAGNYRNIDIAPQELIKLTVAPSDTRRGVTWTQKHFAIRSADWMHNPLQGTFLPRVEVAEVPTSTFAGDAIEIPYVPLATGTYTVNYQPPIINLPDLSALTLANYTPIPLPTWLGGWRQFIYELPDAFTSPDVGGLRAYNRFGQTFAILEVHLSVSAAVSGSAVIVDVNVNGASIFESANRPQIAVGQQTGYSRTFTNAVFAYDSYFTVDVDQGSGTDLAVVILIGG